ncbi:uncharacterized protein PAC_11762 [Phialocephala subalpina]|uniref:Uncharacterized protein n=1 Tax=Phialocephala subalpina TaxID=576137 RepID=A0A1L7XA09_9HELO|nr:uncharacterized protein PAC_11762 [Phialocephala subalpina]
MAFSWQIVASLLVGIFSSTLIIATDVDAGYDPYLAAQAMVNMASHSWEWGTAAEALLELYNSELSVFGSDPFPGGNVPNADPEVFALQYAKQYINTNGQVFVADSAVGDPASLGVSAILIGQSDSKYIDASNRQADYILNDAPKWSNGAISQRPDVAEIWADNMAMSFPFLAYLAVQQGNASLMAETVTQCSLQRAVLKTSQFDNWQHIIGPQSQDTGLWSTGNGWAGYGMVRVLYTLQKWSGSSSMTSQASQLKSWIKDILDGALLSGFDGGLLHNYLNDGSWFGEISGTALLSAVAYRMAVNDPGMFPQKYTAWADTNRKALAQYQGNNGIFSPAVDPYSWLDRTEFTSGSPEGQAFAVYLYTAYRDCVGAGVCAAPPSSVTTISNPGIGPVDILTSLHVPITFSATSISSVQTTSSTSSIIVPTCLSTQPLCTLASCSGTFVNGQATCKSPAQAGCACFPTSTTPGFTCPTALSCGDDQCTRGFDSNGVALCTLFASGCQCIPTPANCGAEQSCGVGGCAGTFDSEGIATCKGKFETCPCIPTAENCGIEQLCDVGGCEGTFDNDGIARCKAKFATCPCLPTAANCGLEQSCGDGGCAGTFDSNGVATCKGKFATCPCIPTPENCGPEQSCGDGECAGTFDSNGIATCKGKFATCPCIPTAANCGLEQSCGAGGCAGTFDSNGVATCKGKFATCPCILTPENCGLEQSCGAGGCAGTFDSNGVATCKGKFATCPCLPTPANCGQEQSCGAGGCAGTFDSDGVAGPEGPISPEASGSPSLNEVPVQGLLRHQWRRGLRPQQMASQPVRVDSLLAHVSLRRPIVVLNKAVMIKDAQEPSTVTVLPRARENGQRVPVILRQRRVGYSRTVMSATVCDGTYNANSNVAMCRNFFQGCNCTPVPSTCGPPQSCSAGGCGGTIDSTGNEAHCCLNFAGCACSISLVWGTAFIDINQGGQGFSLQGAPNECVEFVNANNAVSSYSILGPFIQCEFYDNANCVLGGSFSEEIAVNAFSTPFTANVEPQLNDKFSSYRCYKTN